MKEHVKPMKNAYEICIRETRYPSLTAAAAHLGISRKTLQRRSRNGTIELAGLVRAGHARRVWVDGVEYGQIKTAAYAAGGSETGLRTALWRHGPEFYWRGHHIRAEESRGSIRMTLR